MFDELRHFGLVAEHRSFTEAARRAGLSQPALSASIARLEELMGSRLVHRARGRGGAATRLTAAGEALLPRALAALAAVADGRRAVAEVAGLRAGEVRVGAGATACTFYLPPVLAAFQSAHPAIVVKLREGTAAVLREALRAGEIDLAVVSDESAMNVPGRGELWREDELILVAAPGLDARRAGFVTLPPGTTTRRILDRHFPDARVTMELSGIATVLAFARARAGVALVSRSIVWVDLARHRLVEVRHPATPIPRRITLEHGGVERLPPAAAALRERLKAANLPPDPRGRTRAP
jgi:molybdate transport repressor ModE-like protein